MTENSSDQKTQNSNKQRFLKFTLAIILWILAVLLLFGFRFLPNLPSTHEIFFLDRLPYLLVFVGSTIGALGATTKNDEPVSSPWRDAASLWSWTLLSVGSFAALLYS